MRTGRFIKTVVNGSEQFYQTDNCETLLNSKNLQEVGNLAESGKNVYPDDLAVAYTTITPEFEDGGRIYYTNDTVIIKFSIADADLLLQAASDKLKLDVRVPKYQATTKQSTQPLPDVIIK
jgi:hypothetical protein